MANRKKDWYDPDNALGWSREDFENLIYDYMQNYITGYNPYPINFYAPIIMEIFSRSNVDIQHEREGLTQEEFKKAYKEWLQKELYK